MGLDRYGNWAKGRESEKRTQREGEMKECKDRWGIKDTGKGKMEICACKREGRLPQEGDQKKKTRGI